MIMPCLLAFVIGLLTGTLIFLQIVHNDFTRIYESDGHFWVEFDGATYELTEKK